MPDLASNLMATTKVYYRGQAVAAVAATSEEIARQAARLIEVDYEVLPAVLDVREAMLPAAPHPARRPPHPRRRPQHPDNIIAHHVMAVGDAEAAMAGADIVTVEGEFKTSMVHQGYIEPHASTATWNPDGQITIWTSTQGSFPARQNTSAVLGHPISRIKVIPTEIGGGFGGRIAIYLEPVAALLARKSGKPVKVQMDRADVFEATGPTPGTSIRAKLGATKDGRIVAAIADMAYETGGYPIATPANYATMVAFSCYDIENLKMDGWDVVVNKPPAPRTTAHPVRRPLPSPSNSSSMSSPKSSASTPWPCASRTPPAKAPAAPWACPTAASATKSASRPPSIPTTTGRHSKARTRAAASPPASGSTSAYAPA